MELTIHHVVDFKIGDIKRFEKDKTIDEFFCRELEIIDYKGNHFSIKMFSDERRLLILGKVKEVT